MKSKPVKLIFCAAMMIALLGMMKEVAAQNSVEPVALPFSTTVSSSNWAGYAALPSGTTATSVQGTWTVPTVNSAASPNGYSSMWVGIDGFSSGTVEQIGIEADSFATSQANGTPQYFAWFEMYPASGFYWPSMIITPGDQIHAQVDYLGGARFNLSIQDLTTGVSNSTTETATGSTQRSSAEWIAEAPSVNSTTTPLADFGSVTFSGASATMANGTTGSISDFPNDRINLVPNSGLGASTSTLNAAGDTFTISVTGVPEPSTLAGLGSGGLIGLLLYAWRRRRTA